MVRRVQPAELRVRPEEWILLCWNLCPGTLAGPLRAWFQTSKEGAPADSALTSELHNEVMQAVPSLLGTRS